MLKSFLQLLLNLFVKKSETQFIGAQAFPGDYSQRIEYLNNHLGAFEFVNVAPSDGWLFVTAGNQILYLYLVDNVSGLSTRLQNSGVGLQWPHLYIPVRKGSQWKVALEVTEGHKEGTYIMFIPSVGS